LYNTFRIQNSLKKGDALSPLLFDFGLEYAVRNVQGSRNKLALNRTHQFSVWADYINLLAENINIIEKSTEVLSDASKKAGIEAYEEKTKCLFISCRQTIKQKYKSPINTANKFFESVEKFKRLELTLTNQNCIEV
jgi:hypothetical protein